MWLCKKDDKYQVWPLIHFLPCFLNNNRDAEVEDVAHCQFLLWFLWLARAKKFAKLSIQIAGPKNIEHNTKITIEVDGEDLNNGLLEG